MVSDKRESAVLPVITTTVYLRIQETSVEYTSTTVRFANKLSLQNEHFKMLPIKLMLIPILSLAKF
jgi:hypothetical protein